MNYSNCYSNVMKCLIFLWLLSRLFSLSLVFSSLTMICLNMVFFIICLLDVHWASWTCNYISNFKFVKFLDIHFLPKWFGYHWIFFFEVMGTSRTCLPISCLYYSFCDMVPMVGAPHLNLLFLSFSFIFQRIWKYALFQFLNVR